MSHPKQLRKFKAWAKAMENNASVGSPDYGKSASKSGLRPKTQRRRRIKRRRKKKAKDA